MDETYTNFNDFLQKHGMPSKGSLEDLTPAKGNSLYEQLISVEPEVPNNLHSDFDDYQSELEELLTNGGLSENQ